MSATHEFDLTNIPDDVKPHDLFLHYTPEQVAFSKEASEWLVRKLREEREAFMEKESKPRKPRKKKGEKEVPDLDALPW